MTPTELLKRTNQTRINIGEPPYARILKETELSIFVTCPWCSKEHSHLRIPGQNIHYAERCNPPVEDAYGYQVKTEEQIIKAYGVTVRTQTRIETWKQSGRPQANNRRYRRRSRNED